MAQDFLDRQYVKNRKTTKEKPFKNPFKFLALYSKYILPFNLIVADATKKKKIQQIWFYPLSKSPLKYGYKKSPIG